MTARIITVVEYFGGCPHCGAADVGGTERSDHWKGCSKHKLYWFFGSNLFSYWRTMTPEQQDEDRARRIGMTEIPFNRTHEEGTLLALDEHDRIVSVRRPPRPEIIRSAAHDDEVPW